MEKKVLLARVVCENCKNEVAGEDASQGYCNNCRNIFKERYAK